MSLSTIRKMTEDDAKRLDKAAIRFIKKHEEDALDMLEYTDSETVVESIIQDDKHLQRLWAYAMCRAFRVSKDVRISYGWGHIGISVA